MQLEDLGGWRSVLGPSVDDVGKLKLCQDCAPAVANISRGSANRRGNQVLLRGPRACRGSTSNFTSCVPISMVSAALRLSDGPGVKSGAVVWGFPRFWGASKRS